MDATDRSIPEVAMTKVCPMASTTRMAAATSIAWMLPGLRKVGFSDWKTTTRTTRPMSAAHSARFPGSSRRATRDGPAGVGAGALSLPVIGAVGAVT